MEYNNVFLHDMISKLAANSYGHLLGLYAIGYVGFIRPCSQPLYDSELISISGKEL